MAMVTMEDKWVYPLKRFLRYFPGEGILFPHPAPNLTVMAFKMWAYSPQIAKNDNFWYPTRRPTFIVRVGYIKF